MYSMSSHPLVSIWYSAKCGHVALSAYHLYYFLNIAIIPLSWDKKGIYNRITRGVKSLMLHEQGVRQGRALSITLLKREGLEQ